LIAGALFLESASAQVTTPTPPTTAAADVTGCAQAQMVADSLLSNADARIESARQSNNAAEMRATVAALQTTIRDVRAQLAACANTGASDPQPRHTVPGITNPLGVTEMPVMKTTEPAKPSAPDAHAGHTTTTTPPPPAASAAKPATAPGKPSATDPHAGHTMTPAKPAPKTTAPSTGKPTTPKPAAPDPHAGHTMTPAKPPPKTTQPAAKRAPVAKPAPADPHAGHGAASATQPAQSVADAKAVDPVCGLRVDPAAAASTKHAGETYYFCSTKHRDAFVGNPSKYLPNKQ
jgi:YHS domain-containing protein